MIFNEMIISLRQELGLEEMEELGTNRKQSSRSKKDKKSHHLQSFNDNDSMSEASQMGALRQNSYYFYGQDYQKQQMNEKNRLCLCMPAKKSPPQFEMQATEPNTA